MNRLYMLLALLFCCCGGIINAEQNVNIATEFQAPFDELCVSDNWVHLLTDESEVVAFDYSDDVGVSFVFVELLLLQKDATLDTLQHQIVQWIDGTAETIPMLDFDTDDEDSEADDRFEIKEMQRIEIKGIEWLQVGFDRVLQVVSESYYVVEDLPFETTIAYFPRAAELYFAILNGRLYCADFSAPPEHYQSFKPFFLETMQNL